MPETTDHETNPHPAPSVLLLICWNGGQFDVHPVADEQDALQFLAARARTHFAYYAEPGATAPADARELVDLFYGTGEGGMTDGEHHYGFRRAAYLPPAGGGPYEVTVRDAAVRVFEQATDPDTDDASDMYVLDAHGVSILLRRKLNTAGRPQDGSHLFVHLDREDYPESEGTELAVSVANGPDERHTL